MSKWPVRKVCGAEPRVETGVVEFDGDWPGVFIRGDTAFGWLALLRAADPSLRSSAIDQIASLLAACNVHTNKELRRTPPPLPSKEPR